MGRSYCRLTLAVLARDGALDRSQGRAEGPRLLRQACSRASLLTHRQTDGQGPCRPRLGGEEAVSSVCQLTGLSAGETETLPI